MNLSELLANPSSHDEALVWVDHREEEESIVGYVASAIGGHGDLASEWQDEDWLIVYQGQRFKVPLTYSPHDRYVAISSLAKALEPDYAFWIQTASLDSDTHGLLIAEHAQLQALSPAQRAALEAAFTPLELGHDYFSGLAVPFVGAESANPELMTQSASQRESAKAVVDQVLASPEAKGIIDNMRAELGRLFGIGQGKGKH